MAAPQKGTAFPTGNMKRPDNGQSLAMPYQVQLGAANTPQIFDLFDEIETVTLDLVQTAFVDNSANPAPLQLASLGFGLNLVIPAYSQAVVPISAGQYPRFSAQTATANFVLNLVFYNMPMPFLVWSVANPATPSGGGSGGGSTNVNPVQSSSPVDRSGTITTGGTAQQLMAANATRKGYAVQNQSSGPLYINDKNAAATAGQPSLILQPGAYYENPSNIASVFAVSIFGATTGQAFFAEEYI